MSHSSPLYHPAADQRVRQAEPRARSAAAISRHLQRTHDGAHWRPVNDRHDQTGAPGGTRRDPGGEARSGSPHPRHRDLYCAARSRSAPAVTRTGGRRTVRPAQAAANRRERIRTSGLSHQRGTGPDRPLPADADRSSGTQAGHRRDRYELAVRHAHGPLFGSARDSYRHRPARRCRRAGESNRNRSRDDCRPRRRLWRHGRDQSRQWPRNPLRPLVRDQRKNRTGRSHRRARRQDWIDRPLYRSTPALRNGSTARRSIRRNFCARD